MGLTSGVTRGWQGGRVPHPWKEGGKEEKGREREKEEEREKRDKENRENGEEKKWIIL